MRPITENDYMNAGGPEERKQMLYSYMDRCYGGPDNPYPGMRRLDFLQFDVDFRCLELDKDGMWLMKTKNILGKEKEPTPHLIDGYLRDVARHRRDSSIRGF